MPFCPNCGSYLSPGANVCSCGTTFGHDPEPEKEKKPTEFQKQLEEKRKVCNSLYKKAERLMDDGKYLKAIEYIDNARLAGGARNSAPERHNNIVRFTIQGFFQRRFFNTDK